jgi:hypothetical protein
MIKKYNIAKPEKYTDKTTGAEKTYWANVGTMTTFTKQDGSTSSIIEIPAIGLKASVFEQKPKTHVAPVTQVPKAQEDIYPTETSASVEDINPDDIPF